MNVSLIRNNNYIEILRLGTIFFRNYLEQPFYSKSNKKDVKLIAHLLHHLPPLLLNEGWGDGDIYFFKSTVPDFLQNYKDKSDSNFIQIQELLLELHAELIKNQSAKKNSQ